MKLTQLVVAENCSMQKMKKKKHKMNVKFNSLNCHHFDL